MNAPAGLVESALFAGAAAFLSRHLRHLDKAATFFRSGPRRAPSPGRLRHHVRAASVAIVCLGAMGLVVSSLIPWDAPRRTVLLVSKVAGLALLTMLYPRIASVWLLRVKAEAIRLGRLVFTHESVPSVAAALILTVLVVMHAHWTYASYSRNPPDPYPFMRVLGNEEFRGRSFVTNSDDAAVWYFTRGWAYSISSALPASRGDAFHKYFADWKNYERYDNPDFYLCDYSRFTPWVNLVDHPGEGRKFHDCLEVADYLATTYGYPVVAQDPGYAVLALR
jgi:hypothetical protein